MTLSITRRMNPDWEVRVLTLEAVLQYIDDPVLEYAIRNISAVWQSQSRHILIPETVSDFVRLLILHEQGGVYWDMGCIPTQPLDDWVFSVPKTKGDMRNLLLNENSGVGGIGLANSVQDPDERHFLAFFFGGTLTPTCASEPLFKQWPVIQNNVIASLPRTSFLRDVLTTFMPRFQPTRFLWLQDGNEKYTEFVHSTCFDCVQGYELGNDRSDEGAYFQGFLAMQATLVAKGRNALLDYKLDIRDSVAAGPYTFLHWVPSVNRQGVRSFFFFCQNFCRATRSWRSIRVHAI